MSCEHIPELKRTAEQRMRRRIPKFLTEKQAKSLAAKWLSLDPSIFRLAERLSEVGYDVEHWAYPKDSGSKTFVIKSLVSCIPASQSMLVHVQNCQIWPSSGHLPLAKSLWTGLGSKFDVLKRPGCLFAPGRHDDAASVLILAACFDWDCILVSESGQHVLALSHDEYAQFASSDTVFMDKVRNVLGSRSS